MSDENKNIENNQEENQNRNKEKNVWYKLNKRFFKQLIFICSFLFVLLILLFLMNIFFNNQEQNMNYFKDKYKFRRLPNFKINRDVSSSSVLLLNGNVLFTGGLVNTHESTKTTEIYNPIENKFYRNVNMSESRANHSSILLKNGDVLVTGGIKYSKYFSATELKSAEIFKTNENKFYSISDMIAPMSNHKMFLLKNGNVLIVSSPYHIELFEFKTNTFKELNLLSSEKVIENENSAFECNEVVLEKGEKIVLFFRDTTKSNHLILLLNLANLSIETLNSNISLTYDFFPVKFNKDNIMIIGGNKKRVGPGLKMCKLFNFRNDIIESCSNLNIPRYNHIAINLDDGNIIILGGKTGFGKTLKLLKNTELYIPMLDKFIIFKNMKYRRNNIRSIKLSNGNYILYGSYNSFGIKKYTPELLVVKE